MARQRGNRLWRRGRILWTRYRGERRSTGCSDPVAARAVIAEWQRIDASPAYAAASATTLGVACKRSLAVLREKGRAMATLAFVEQKAGHLVRVLGDDLPLVRVTARLVDSYVEARRGETASAHTIAKELGVLRQVLRVARRRGEFTEDPRAILPIGFSPEYEPRTTRLSEADAARLLDALPRERAAWVAFAIATGARLGEVVRARREDVRLDARTVHLRGTKTAASLRDVPITSLGLPYVERALRDADGARGLLFSPWQNVRRDLARAGSVLI